MRIKQAETPGEIDEVRRLFLEFEAFLGIDLCFEGFEEELAGLPGKYAPPGGALLMGLEKDNVSGCVALRALARGECEMKRLFVRPEFRRTGLGRLLAHEVIGVACQLGYSLMRLDTFENLTEAIGLYESLGFRKTDAYYENPLRNVVYMELDLQQKQTDQQDESTLPSSN